MRNRFGKWLFENGSSFGQPVLLVGDIGFGIFDEFRDNFPTQFVNCGIAEQNMIGVSAGLASQGIRPIVYTIIPFLIERPYEFVKNLIGHQNLPVVLVGVGGGLSYDTLGFTHFAREDLILANTIPNLKIFIPYDPSSIANICEQALTLKGPSYIRLMKGGEPEISAQKSAHKGGVAFNSDGGDIALITYGTTTNTCVNAQQKLLINHNIKADVFAVICPDEFDSNILLNYKSVILIEEQIFPGLSMEIFKRSGFPENFKMIHLNKDQEYVVASREDLLTQNNMDEQSIISLVIKTLSSYKD